MLKLNKEKLDFIIINTLFIMLIMISLNLVTSPEFIRFLNNKKISQIEHDIRIIDFYIINNNYKVSSLPSGNFIKKSNINNLENKKIYFKGKEINNLDQFSDSELYLLNKDNLEKKVNTNLHGEFIYTKKGIVYIENNKINILDKSISQIKRKFNL